MTFWRLAGPVFATPQALFDFVVEELGAREHKDARRIRPVRVALQNQRDDLLAFAGVPDEKLATLTQAPEMSGYLVRSVCLLHGKPEYLARVLARLERPAVPAGRPIQGRVRRCDARYAEYAAQQFAG